MYSSTTISKKLREVGSARGVMVIVVGNGHGDKFKSWTRPIAFHIGMNPIILPPAMGK